MASVNRSIFLCCLLAIGAAFSTQAIAQLSLVPANPTPLDLVRLHWTHVGCTNPDSVRVSMQANRGTISADRAFFIDCGTVQGYFDEYTVGRLPAGEYDIELIVNPPPPTLGPSQLIGPIHLTVGPLPATGSLLPHEDYSDAWWDPTESGQALTVKQSGDKLFAGWNVYDASGRPVWYSLQPGSWTRDSANNLRYVWMVYKTTGPYWGGLFDPGAVRITAVGTASFVPQAVSRARFEYTIEGVSGSKQLQRFAF
jgi:hypothetical protein